MRVKWEENVMMLDLLKSRRSIRKFQDKEIEKEKIDTILKCALLAPSSRARRPWEFIVVSDKQILEKLSRTREPNSSFLAGAQTGIVVIADSTVSDVWVEDSTIAATLIQLTAHSLGMGSCWTQVRERFHQENQKAEDYTKEVLGIPEQYKVECMIALGYPDEVKNHHTEEELLFDKIHNNKF